MGAEEEEEERTDGYALPLTSEMTKCVFSYLPFPSFLHLRARC
jgi:hypothetical protein